MKKIEKLPRKYKGKAGTILARDYHISNPVLDQLDEIVDRLNEQKEENEAIYEEFKRLEKKLTTHTHLLGGGMPSY